MNYYVDNFGRLIYENFNIKSEITGIEEYLVNKEGEITFLFTIEILWD